MDISLLIINIIFYPLILIAISLIFLIDFYNTKYFFVVSTVSLFFIGFAIFWNTKYGIGGAGFIPPLKNYLRHQETDNDKIIARVSIILIFGIFLILSLILSF